MSKLITSFEIHASNLDRAVKFYGAILGKEVPIKNIGGENGGLLSAEDDSIMGIIRSAPEYAKPSDQGTNVYFRIEKDLEGVLAKVKQLGGNIVVPKMDAGGFGQFAWIIDSEGNRVGLNQPK